MKKTKMKKTNFLFQNAVIVIFISYESLILDDTKYIFIARKILNFCFYERQGKHSKSVC